MDEKEKEKAKRFVSKSRRTKPKHGTSKIKSKCRKSKKKKSSTTSKSNSAVSPHRDIEKEEKKEEKKEDVVKKVDQRKDSEKDEEKRETKKSVRKRTEWKEEKEPESESDHDADLSLKRSHVVVPTRKGKPQKVSIKHNDVDEKVMERLLKKLKENKAEPPRPQVALDEKSKIFMDRVEKKSYPVKYATKNKSTLLVDDDSEFFKPTVPQKVSSATVIPTEDSYEHVPKLADVMKMPGENVYQTTMMGEVPFWAAYLEPDENDMQDVEPPISVGTDHVHAYQKKELQLKTNKSTKLVLDEFQPFCLLTARDEKFFHPHLVFSNTVRSLINVAARIGKECSVIRKSQMKSDDDEDGEKEESTQPDDLNLTISLKQPKSFTYDRSRPILSAREEKGNQLARARTPKKIESKSSTIKIEVEQKQRLRSS
ncbi:hypothetical protein GCK72_002038 [Caenorhabditis remanei]|uniref:Uncharacterized protein n=1 Tax=Caenorhabditis remanei TaxID=31234 RepID=A0A6A5HPS9_CAERE|nr:hypothetical protein GCK72_002038 [Caenorhabditis remanei]KAF1770220.1 hypothetical protein GCK72_002038 [Caenorhabditis remanei]